MLQLHQLRPLSSICIECVNKYALLIILAYILSILRPQQGVREMPRMYQVYSLLLPIYALLAVVYGQSIFERLLAIVPIVVSVVIAKSQLLPKFKTIPFHERYNCHLLTRYIGSVCFLVACLALSLWFFGQYDDLFLARNATLHLIDAFLSGNKDVRDILYPIRSSWMNGSFELAYMLFLGCCAIPSIMPSRYRKLILLLSSVGALLLGSLEVIVMARYYSYSVFVALFSFIVYHRRSAGKEGMSQLVMTSFVCLTLSASLLLPSFSRQLVSGHAPYPWVDSTTMSKGVAMRNGQSAVAGINLSGVSAGQHLAQVTDRVSVPKLDLAKGIRDFACSSSAGPFIENYLCSGYLHQWTKDTYLGYYGGNAFPVLPTYIIISLGGKVAVALASINYILLTIYPALGFSRVISSRLASSLLCFAPLWTVKLISFWRGDPMHSGISFAWIVAAILGGAYCVRVIAKRSAIASPDSP